MTEYGTFAECTVNGVTKKGKDYMDYLDDQVRKAYYAPDESEETGHRGDIMWYLWLSGNSPLFGKDQMTTFERCFIADKKTHKEHTMPYYKLIDKTLDWSAYEWSLISKIKDILSNAVTTPVMKYKDNGGIERETPLVFREGIKAIFQQSLDIDL
jgi:fructose-1,6-bisphosphatase